jgi:HEPN domain-containing protein
VTKADDDFDFAQVNLEEQRPFYAQICFHFQQSAEKYLKSYIIANELDFKKSHDLQILLDICISKDKSFEEVGDDCVFLSTFYIETRYPVHWPTQFSQEETRKCFKAAQRIQSFVKRRLDI